MLRAAPISLSDANAFVEAHHRHSKTVRFHLFSISALDDFRLCGVAIIMRPVSQHRAFGGWVCEVSRLCTDGTRNAASFLLARASEAAFAMGYLAIQTYTLQTESGSSLRAAGWVVDALIDRPRSWDTPSRSRPNAPSVLPRVRWVRENARAINIAQKGGE